MDLEPDAEPEMTSGEEPAFEPTTKSEASQSSAGCGAGTVMVNGVCQLAKTSGTSMAIEPIYLIIGVVAIGGIIGAIAVAKRGSKTPKPTAKPKPVKQKHVEKEETSSSCSNCGALLNPKAKFCGSCGTART